MISIRSFVCLHIYVLQDTKCDFNFFLKTKIDTHLWYRSHGFYSMVSFPVGNTRFVFLWNTHLVTSKTNFWVLRFLFCGWSFGVRRDWIKIMKFWMVDSRRVLYAGLVVEKVIFTSSCLLGVMSPDLIPTRLPTSTGKTPLSLLFGLVWKFTF